VEGEVEEEEAGVSIRVVEPRVGVGPMSFTLGRGVGLLSTGRTILIRGTLSKCGLNCEAYRRLAVGLH
jgi:hypothetical protein